MASTTKPGTKWGSFFEKAVAGVESRLDTILGDEDETPKSGRQSPALKPQADKREPAYSMTAAKTPDYASQIAGNKKPDRLQERLAKAIGGRNSPLSGSVTPSLASTSPRTSLDKDTGIEGLQTYEGDRTGTPVSVDHSEHVAKLNTTGSLTTEVEDASSERAYDPTTRTILDDNNKQATINGSSTPRRSAESDFNDVQRQQEVHAYLEQIESLRAKLQFLTGQAAADARERANNAEKGSTEQQLAQKDEKISLLMEEGTKMSQNEMKLMTTIKTLRARSSEDQKQIAKAKQLEEQAEKTARNLQERLRAAEALSKDDSKQKAILENMRKDLEQAKQNNLVKDHEISDLRKQVLQNAIAGQETEKIRKELESERLALKRSQEEVSDSKLERSLLEDRHKAHIKELESKHDRGLRDTKATELDLRREVQIMESQLETYKTKAEEFSSDSKGDVQAKLVRQIETLQSSYSVASENWRGIESSLMARIAVFEKDLSDSQKKEAELRRKLRELGSKCKDLESQTEIAKSHAQDLEENLAKDTEKLKQASITTTKLEAELQSARADLVSTKEIMEARLERAEAEKREVMQESLALRAKSSAVKTGFEPSISSSRRYPQSPGLSIPGGLGFPDRSQTRRASAQQSHGFMPQRQDSSISQPQSRKSSVPPTPIINADDDDDFFANTPATPPERTINDMISTSTAGVGPSVQLVERMSAAVRRLESEKESTKDEIERLSAQRDEARNQVVGLMQEAEDKKKLQEKIASLEKEIQELNDKLQTTLEMLGEKSELVEELRADISDMKEIYRATLESTVR